MIRTDWLSRNALYYPDKTAIVWQPTEQRLSYAECNQIGADLGEWFRTQHGLQKGDRIAILAENSLEHVLIFLACQKSGLILVPVNFRLTPKEVAYILDDCDPSLIVYASDFEGHLASQNRSSLLLSDVPKSFAPQSNASPRLSFEAPQIEDVCMILYTSGTTGKPKGAMITHQMLLWNALNTAMRLNLTTQDVSFNAAPFYHTGGWNVLLTPFLLYGATTILLDKFDAPQLLGLCESEKMSIIWGVPTMMKMLADAPNFASADLSSVRYAIVGGEPMPIPLISLFQEKGIPIRQGFGMTEVGPNCFSLPEKDAIRKAGSIGFANFFIDTKIVDDGGREVAQGESGELWMRSPVVTSGYWRNSAATAQSIDVEGWFKTGDMVRQDEEGYFFVVGRKKDMYISGGENVYPAEVEAILYAHPVVSEAAVVGVPHPKWGETGFAFLVLHPDMQTPTNDDLKAYCQKNLAKYKIPTHFRIVEMLPKGHSGKILKLDLVDQAKTILAHSSS